MAEAEVREIKGWHVLAFTVAAFGVIIAVNLLMAYKAISTFPGLEVKNSYVASQTFDADRQAQLALGWTLLPSYDGEKQKLELAFTDAAGKPLVVEGLKVLLGRVTVARDDSAPQFIYEGGVYVAPAKLDPGKWMLHVTARSGDGVLFQQRLNLFVKG
ncbi:MAG: FixH family protein [Cypionkella sp.]|uniref:FixH family protein n=1 Tax=Cypionkella sp. TaxID=2811411 RepID=UPI002ABACC4F|nr:FixH family protein [Cypionkella sp.]MDZ4310770.1 FixH family protein [Cypionkella sp.]